MEIPTATTVRYKNKPSLSRCCPIPQQRPYTGNKTTRTMQVPKDHGYNDFDGLGLVSSTHDRMRQREKKGLCLECPINPVKLYDIKKKKYNLLAKEIKEPLTLPGQSYKGKCLSCYPHLDPDRGSHGFSQTAACAFAPSRVFKDKSHATSHKEMLYSSTSELTTVSSGTTQTLKNFDDDISELTTLTAETVNDPRKSDRRSTYPPVHSSNSLAHKADNSDESENVSMQKMQSKNGSLPLLIPSNSRSTSLDPKTKEAADDSNCLGSLPESNAPQDQATSTSDTSRRSYYMERHQGSPVRNRPGLLKQPEPASPSNSQPSPDDSEHSRTKTAPIRQLMSEDSLKVQGDSCDVPQLEALVSDLMSTGASEDFVMDILLDAMGTNRKNDQVQLYCVTKLNDMCTESHDKKNTLISQNGHMHIQKAMIYHARNIQLLVQCSNVLHTLSKEPEHIYTLVQENVCAAIVQMLGENVNEQEIVESTICTIRILSADEEAKAALLVASAPAIVAKAMLSHQSVTYIQRDGCAILSNAAVDVESGTVSKVPYEVMEAVVSGIENHESSDDVIASACFCLKNYTFEDENLRTLYRFKNLPQTLEAILKNAGIATSRDDAGVILDSLRLQRHLDSFLEEIVESSLLETGRGQNAVAKLTETMIEYYWSPRLTRGISEQLAEVTSSVDLCYSAATVSALENVLDAMKRFRSDTAVQMSGFAIINRFSMEPEFRPVLYKCDALMNINDSLSAHASNREIQFEGQKVLTQVKNTLMSRQKNYKE